MFSLKLNSILSRINWVRHDNGRECELGFLVPTYDFHCGKCKKPFEVFMSIAEYNDKGKCPKCKKTSKQRIFTAKIHFIGTAVQSAEYNPAFGQVVKNKRHRDELAKRHGLIEVGNEKPERIHKEMDNDRLKKLRKSWDDV